MSRPLSFRFVPQNGARNHGNRLWRNGFHNLDGYSIRQFAEVHREPKETDGMNALATFGGIWNSVQAWLLPQLEDEVGELDDKHRQFVAVCEICALQERLTGYRWVGSNGFTRR